MIHLPLIGNRVLVFDVDDARKLRELGIVGVLVGTLPKAPQQNVFLGLPLQLSIYEVLWLLDHHLAIVVDNVKFHKLLVEKSTPSQINEGNTVILSGPSKARFVTTPNVLPNAISLDPAGFEVSRDKFISLQTKLPANFEEKYHAFTKLRSLGHYIMPGLRFGGTFVSYPGDPLGFHSHLIVKCVKREEEVKLLDIVTAGRLATAVKKAWVLVSPPEDEKPGDAFSIEWAGFG